jgi:hypothetical protein
MARHDRFESDDDSVLAEERAGATGDSAYAQIVISEEIIENLKGIDRDDRIQWVSLAARAVVDHHNAEVEAAADPSLADKAAHSDAEKNFLLGSLTSESERRMALMLAQLEIGPVEEPGEDEDTGVSN